MIAQEAKDKIAAMAGGDRVLFQVVGGSRLYGYAVTESDYDIRVVTLPDKLFFQPNLRMAIVGFDQFPQLSGDQYANSTVSNMVIPEQGDVPFRKYDIMMSPLPLFLKQCLTGAYFLLSNLKAEVEEYEYADSQWIEKRNELVALIPQAAYTISGMHLLRDLKDFLRRIDLNVGVKNKEKELVKLTYISHFLKLQSLRNHPVDYTSLRNQTYETTDQLKNAVYPLIGMMTEVSQIKFDGRDIIPFKTKLCEVLNYFYGEEIFRNTAI